MGPLQETGYLEHCWSPFPKAACSLLPWSHAVFSLCLEHSLHTTPTIPTITTFSSFRPRSSREASSDHSDKLRRHATDSPVPTLSPKCTLAMLITASISHLIQVQLSIAILLQSFCRAHHEGHSARHIVGPQLIWVQ